MPFSGTSYALIAVERAGIQRLEVRRVEGSTLLIELPLTEQHAPNVSVSVTLVKGVDDENPIPVYRSGTINLPVEPVHKRLEVTVTPSAALARPGDTVTLDVQTLGPDGEPVEAEVGLGVTDQAILALMGPNRRSRRKKRSTASSRTMSIPPSRCRPCSMAWRTRCSSSRRSARSPRPAGMPPMATATADMAMEEAAMDGALMAGGPAEVSVRQDFQQTPLWAPRVTTDPQGAPRSR